MKDLLPRYRKKNVDMIQEKIKENSHQANQIWLLSILLSAFLFEGKNHGEGILLKVQT